MFGTVVTSTRVSGHVWDSYHVLRSLRTYSGQSSRPQESPDIFGTVITSTGVSGDVRDSHHVHRSLRRWTLNTDTRQFWASTYIFQGKTEEEEERNGKKKLNKKKQQE